MNESHLENENTRYEARLSKVETIVASLADSSASFHNDMRKQVGTLRDALETQSNAVASLGKTSWPLVASVIFGIITSFIAAVGLMITIGTLAFAPLWMTMNETKQNNRMHAESEGHPIAMMNHASLDQEVDGIKNEFNRWNSSLETRLLDQEDWRQHHDETVASLNARQDRHLVELDRQMQRVVETLFGQYWGDVNENRIKTIETSRFDSQDGDDLESRIRRLEDRNAGP